jgi:predicted ester cyclase
MKKTLHTFIACAALAVFASCNDAGSNDDHKDAAKDKEADMKARYSQIAEAFNSGNLVAIDTLLSADSKDHSSDTAMHTPDGPAGLKAMIADMRAGSPDMKTEIKHMAVDGDVLLAYGTMSGTNSGSMMGMPPTNRKWSGQYCDVVKFGSDMKMTEHWGVYDEMKMMKDLGLIPDGPPPAAPATK